MELSGVEVILAVNVPKERGKTIYVGSKDIEPCNLTQAKNVTDVKIVIKVTTENGFPWKDKISSVVRNLYTVDDFVLYEDMFQKADWDIKNDEDKESKFEKNIPLWPIKLKVTKALRIDDKDNPSSKSIVIVCNLESVRVLDTKVFIINERSHQVV